MVKVITEIDYILLMWDLFINVDFCKRKNCGTAFKVTATPSNTGWDENNEYGSSKFRYNETAKSLLIGDTAVKL